MTFSSLPMIQVAFVLLAAGACGGVFFTALSALRVRYPAWFGLGHGLLGLVAVVLLAVALVLAPPGVAPPRAWWALAVLAGALAGGALLFRVIFPGRHPLWPAFVHGGAALLGLGLLFPVAFSMP